MTLIDRLKGWAAELKTQLMTLWYCRSHPDTPLAAKLLAALVVGYALSPIDLIPDFVPVLGYLDEVIVVPIGILLVLKLIPSDLMTEFRAEAAQIEERPKSYAGAAIVVALWISAALLILWLLWPRHAA